MSKGEGRDEHCSQRHGLELVRLIVHIRRHPTCAVRHAAGHLKFQVRRSFFADASLPFVFSGIDTLLRPFLDFAFDPRRCAATELDGSWEAPLLDGVVDAAARLAADRQYFL